jgi:hypothetical protein
MAKYTNISRKGNVSEDVRFTAGGREGERERVCGFPYHSPESVSSLEEVRCTTRNVV